MLRPNALPAIIVALALLAAGCGSTESDGKHPDYEKALAGSPPPLAAIHRQANRLLPGGRAAFEDRIAALRGYPVVVNIWASWCGPCRLEFPSFQQLSAEYGKRVAFLGVDSEDSDDAARTFLRDHPVPYPSYTDPDEEIAESIDASRGYPVTAFYDRRGELVHFSYIPYTDPDALRADIRRYALAGAPAGGSGAPKSG